MIGVVWTASTRGRCRVCGIEPDSGRELHSFVSATSAPAVAGADHKNIGARPGGAGCSWSFGYAQHRCMRADRSSQFTTPQRHAPTSNDVESGNPPPPEWRRFRGKFDARRAVWVTWLTAPGRHGGMIDDQCRPDSKHARPVPCLRDRAGQRPRIAQLCKRRGRRRTGETFKNNRRTTVGGTHTHGGREDGACREGPHEVELRPMRGEDAGQRSECTCAASRRGKQDDEK